MATCAREGCDNEAKTRSKVKGRPSLYCSDECRRTAKASRVKSRRTRVRIVEHTCRYCGKKFLQTYKVGRPRAYCTDECSARGMLKLAHEANERAKQARHKSMEAQQ